MISLNSKLKEIYAHPVGHDALYKVLLQLSISERVIHNPILGNMRLGTLAKIAGKKAGTDFFNSLVTLLNNETDVPLEDVQVTNNNEWWRKAVFYQIYPKSFMDTNGDGIGDIRGIISKLDYLKDLGVDAIWLSPIYMSPNDDNGYDISDYREIAAEYGTMADFNALLNGTHERGMKLIMDLVVNHTSDEHEWFKKAIDDPNSKEHSYYFLKKSDEVPNNWTSFFSGPAWKYIEQSSEWALCLFSKKQMDLNWDNEEVRREVKGIVEFWLKKGVDGFRLDVINYISKAQGLPNGDEFIGSLMGYTGIEHYYYGPKLHQYLHELKTEAFEPYNAFSVGETPGIGREMAKLLSAPYRRELDMVFCFDILDMPGKTRFDDYKYKLSYLKRYYMEWMQNFSNTCHMALFYDNHDNPRMLGKIDPRGEHFAVLAKLLGVIQLTLKGSPFIYQGQELGFLNGKFNDISELRDVESINLYNELIKTMPKDEALKKVLAGARDHARLPMVWDKTKYSGFSSIEPWLYVESEFGLDAKSQEEDEKSVLSFYKRLIDLRKNSEALLNGGIEFIHTNRKNIFSYKRQFLGETYCILCNITNKCERLPFSRDNITALISNYDDESDKLRPYEAIIFRY